MKNLDPLKWLPRNTYFEIFGPPELMFQEMFGLPVKYLDPSYNVAI